MTLQRILLNDTFMGANDTALTAHWPDKCYIPGWKGATWATLTGHTIPTIQSNAASGTAHATDNSAIIDVNRHHVTIDADIRAGTTSGDENWIKFLMRCYDVSNWIGVQVGETSSASFNLNILKFVGGSATTLATRTCTFADATDYHINIKCTGNLVYVNYSDGGADLQFHFTSNYYAPGTNVGFWMYIATADTAFPLVYNIKVLG